jgi:hypothetical protein
MSDEPQKIEPMSEENHPTFRQRLNSLKLAISFVLLVGAAAIFFAYDEKQLIEMGKWAMTTGGTFLAIFLGARMESK